ncbi:MAG: low molecular weight protein arginine phosphatase [Peptococcaceae bacterium]|nr:low molecular weight protein arginine phosphatase [Peptococcaceae bacterium]
MELVFVCTGNTCRSSMAEGLARHIWAKRWKSCGDLRVSSAGVAAWPGEMASPQAVYALREKGIDIHEHRSRPLTSEITEHAGLLLTMTKKHKEQILEIFPETAGKVFMLAEFAGHGPVDMPDPFGESKETYQLCADALESLIIPALERIAGN